MRLFMWLIISTTVCTVAEAISWLSDGQPGRMMAFVNPMANATLLSLNMTPMLFWILYLHQQILGDLKQAKRQWLSVAILLLINFACAVSSPWSEIYFGFTPGNVYYRGKGQIIGFMIYYALFLVALKIILNNRKRMPRKQMVSMLAFTVPPLLGLILQSVFFGMNLVWASTSVAILMAYVSLMTQSLQTDHLTGLFNRRHLDNELEHRIGEGSGQAQFGALMMDIDDFKKINDSFGHLVGDRAIESTAMILKRFFKQEDFVARYAGDEFVVLLNVSDREVLKAYKLALEFELEQFNIQQNEPYKLSLSIGAALYDEKQRMSQEAFLHHIDKLMYQEKKRKKEAKKGKTAE